MAAENRLSLPKSNETGRSGGGLRHPTGGYLPFAAQSEDGKADRVQRVMSGGLGGAGALRSGGLSAGFWPSSVDALCGLLPDKGYLGAFALSQSPMIF
jgi:hypothetical protein